MISDFPSAAYDSWKTTPPDYEDVDEQESDPDRLSDQEPQYEEILTAEEAVQNIIDAGGF